MCWEDCLMQSGDLGVSVNLKQRRNGSGGLVRFCASLDDGQVQYTVKRKQEIESHGSKAMTLLRG